MTKTTKIYSRNTFDDDIFNSKRLRQVMRGSTRQLHLREYNKGGGDYETLCRAVALLAQFYAPQGGQVAFKDSVIAAAEICLTLRPYSSATAALNAPFGCEMLDDVIYAPALIAWCAVCEVKGAYAHDMQIMWRGNDLAVNIITAACRVFENLADMRYTDNDLTTIVKGGGDD